MRNRVHQPSGCLRKVLVRTQLKSSSHQGFAESLAQSAAGRCRRLAGLFGEASALGSLEMLSVRLMRRDGQHRSIAVHDFITFPGVFARLADRVVASGFGLKQTHCLLRLPASVRHQRRFHEGWSSVIAAPIRSGSLDPALPGESNNHMILGISSLPHRWNYPFAEANKNPAGGFTHRGNEAALRSETADHPGALGASEMIVHTTFDNGI